MEPDLKLQDKAKALMRRHLWTEAIPVLEMDADANPADPWSPLYIGCCYYELRNYEKTIDYAQQAADLRPDSPTPPGLEGDAYCAMGDYPRAEQRYRYALELDSKDPLACLLYTSPSPRD